MVLSLLEGKMSTIWYQNDQKYSNSLIKSLNPKFSISCSQRNLSWNITGVGAFFVRLLFTLSKACLVCACQMDTTGIMQKYSGIMVFRKVG